MPIFENFTRHAVDEFVGYDRDGVEFYSLIVKVAYAWDEDGRVEATSVTQDILPADVYAGDPAASGAVVPGDYVPYKRRVDVLLAGRIQLPTPVAQIEVALQVGRRLRKTMLVTGERVWIPGVMSTLALTRPQPFGEMALVWERSFGGTDPDHPDCFEPRNPVGRGMRKKAKGQEGQLAPNFEDPRRPMTAWDDRPAPVGFGPVAPHWQPRVRLAGTYDETWQDEQFPLLPVDFDEQFYNCAPADQQFDEYVVGEEVRLDYMTPRGHERFELPEFEVPVKILLPRGVTHEDVVTPDTVLIEPAERRLTLVGRVRFHPRPDMFALRSVFVGPLSRGRLRALEVGKPYLDLRATPPTSRREVA